MNYKALALDEARFTLFAFKRCLRDKNGLTPTMIQFYERSVEVLSKKISTLIEDEQDPRPYGDRARDRVSEIPTTWPNN